MSRGGKLALVVIVWAAAIGGFWVGRNDTLLPGFARLTATPAAEATGPIIYFRHPDGDPVYSAAPRSTEDGRAFIAVHASEDVSFDAPAESEKAASPSERRIRYYRNPMGLPDTSSVPKKDPMGMDYIPVYEGEDVDGVDLKLSPGKIQRTGVKVAPVARVALGASVRVPAAISLDERLVSVISTRTEAFIESVANVTTGQRIDKGTELVELYAREISLAGADLVTNLGGGGPTSGAIQRLKNLGVPDSVIAEVRKTGKVPLRVVLTAPTSGVVLERNAIVGMMAPAGQTLFRIADTSKVWAIADVPEYVLASIQPGARAAVRIRALRGREFIGRVDLIYPEIAPQTRTARIRIELANPEGLLLANMFAEAEILTGEGTPVIAVPEAAVIDTGERQLVFVEKGDGRFEPRDVEIGSRSRDLIEIRTGLDGSERVVVSANFLLDAESNLNAAIAAMDTPKASP